MSHPILVKALELTNKQSQPAGKQIQPGGVKNEIWGKPDKMREAAYHAHVDALGAGVDNAWHKNLLGSMKSAYSSGDVRQLHHLHGQVAEFIHHGYVPEHWGHSIHHGINDLLHHAPIPPVSKEARAKVEQHQRQMIEQMHPFEEMIAVGHDGAHHIASDHHPSMIDLTSHWDRLQAIPHGAILSHNHPQGWHYHATNVHPEGQSFSGADLASAFGIGARELHVVSPKWRYSLLPGKMGQRFSPATWEAAEEHYGQIEKDIRRHYGQKIARGEISARDANTWHQDDLVRTLAEHLGMDYHKEPHGYRPSAATTSLMRAKWGHKRPDEEDFA